MSEILIKGMEIPKSCGDCKFCFIRPGDSLCESDMFCFLINKELCLYKNRESINNIKMGDCPLVKVPQHGRLGDLDFVESYLTHNEKEFGCPFDVEKLLDWIREAPTVIAASKERE